MCMRCTAPLEHHACCLLTVAVTSCPAHLTWPWPRPPGSCSFTSLSFLSTTTPSIYSLVGSLNKVPLALMGLFAFNVPWTLPNLMSVLVGERRAGRMSKQRLVVCTAAPAAPSPLAQQSETPDGQAVQPQGAPSDPVCVQALPPVWCLLWQRTSHDAGTGHVVPFFVGCNTVAMGYQARVRECECVNCVCVCVWRVAKCGQVWRCAFRSVPHPSAILMRLMWCIQTYMYALACCTGWTASVN